jgi:hypothetical protein
MNVLLILFYCPLLLFLDILHTVYLTTTTLLWVCLSYLTHAAIFCSFYGLCSHPA